MSEDIDIDHEIEINLMQDDFANESITAMWHEDDLEFYFHESDAPSLVLKQPTYSWDLTSLTSLGCSKPSCWGRMFSGDIKIMKPEKFPKNSEGVMCILEEDCNKFTLKTKAEGSIIICVRKAPGARCPSNSDAQEKLACGRYYLVGELELN